MTRGLKLISSFVLFRLSLVAHELDPTPAVGSHPTPGDFCVEIFGVGCLPTPGIKSLVWDHTQRTPVWDWKRM